MISEGDRTCSVFSSHQPKDMIDFDYNGKHVFVSHKYLVFQHNILC